MYEATEDMVLLYKLTLHRNGKISAVKEIDNTYFITVDVPIKNDVSMTFSKEIKLIPNDQMKPVKYPRWRHPGWEYWTDPYSHYAEEDDWWDWDYEREDYYDDYYEARYYK